MVGLLRFVVCPPKLRPAYAAADAFWVRENALHPVGELLSEERDAFYAAYEGLILRGAGVEVSPELALRIFKELLAAEIRFALFDDVPPPLARLKGLGLTLGLVTNLRRDLDKVCRDLGLTPYLDFGVSSQEAGAEKPHPPIFLAALREAGVEPVNAIHVGDQYEADVLGARGVGISALLIDRDNLWSEIQDCPRLSTLAEVEDYL